MVMVVIVVVMAMTMTMTMTMTMAVAMTMAMTVTVTMIVSVVIMVRRHIRIVQPEFGDSVSHNTPESTNTTKSIAEVILHVCRNRKEERLGGTGYQRDCRSKDQDGNQARRNGVISCPAREMYKYR